MKKNIKETFIIEEQEHKTKDNSSRRKFIKKAAYAAPTLLAMGSLLKPKDVLADGSQPPGPPNWP